MIRPRLGPLLLLLPCGAAAVLTGGCHLRTDAVASVGGETIDRRELDSLAEVSARGLGPTGASTAEGRSLSSEVLTELVKEKLLEQEASRRGLELGPGETARDALAAEISETVTPTDEEVAEFYRQHPQLYARAPQTRFLHLRSSDSAPETFRELTLAEFMLACDEASATDPEGRRWGDIGWLEPGEATWWPKPEWDPRVARSTRSFVDSEGRRHFFRGMHYRPPARFELEQVAADCRARLIEMRVRAEIKGLLLRLAAETAIEVLDQTLPAEIDPETVARSEPGPPLELLRRSGSTSEGQTGMVLVAGGRFTTGSSDEEIDRRVEICREWVEPALGEGSCLREKYEDEVQRRVVVDSFWIDTTEVTWEGYQTFVEATRHRPLPRDGSGRAGYPVTQVSQADAAAYCRWRGKRLPTADEWEYAARGPEGRRYPWGDEEPDGTRGNFCDTRCPSRWRNEDHDDGFEGPAPVGTFPRGATPEGVLDMAGNVREWTGTSEGLLVHVKGGGFRNAIDDLIAADVRVNHRATMNSTIGFRCVGPAAARAAQPGAGD